VRAVQSGLFQDTACAVANYARLNLSSCTEFDVNIGGSSAPSAPRLTVLRSGYGLYELQLIGDQGATYQLQTSPDLVNWLQWTNAPGPLFYIELPAASLPGAPGKFYRARWP
jgi:hypothetical protein